MVCSRVSVPTVEIVGYVGRALATNNTGKLIPYMMQSLLLLIAPVLFAASLYMTLSRVIRAVEGERYSFIPPRWLTRIFVCSDIFGFIIQGSGAGLLANTKSSSSATTGNNIIIAGLVFQIITFALFISAAVVFHVRARGRVDSEKFRNIPWQSMLVMLYVTSKCIIARNVFRVVEYGMGQDGYFLNHEWSVYVFDGVLMLATMLCFAWRYPSSLRQRKSSDSGVELITGENEWRPTKIGV